MTTEMCKALAKLPYEEKLRMVAELIEFSRAFKASGQIDREGSVDVTANRKQQDQDAV